ncbi:MAG: DUF4199 domain-containing protein [Chitinophagaceae bacterium]
MKVGINPSLKGLITGAVMIAVFLIIYATASMPDSRLQYLVYGLYGAGIVWTLVRYRRSDSFTGAFMDLFTQGFRCFVVVTLCMALFYGIFNYMHPEFATETALAYQKELAEKNQMMPSEIESAVATFKKQYTLKLVSGAIFGYLIIGAGITAALSALLTRRQ